MLLCRYARAKGHKQCLAKGFFNMFASILSAKAMEVHLLCKLRNASIQQPPLSLYFTE